MPKIPAWRDGYLQMGHRWNPDRNLYEYWSVARQEWSRSWFQRPSPLAADVYVTISYDDTWAEPVE